MVSNPAVNRTLRDKAAQRRLRLRSAYISKGALN
jgi:hypothetical protein